MVSDFPPAKSAFVGALEFAPRGDMILVWDFLPP